MFELIAIWCLTITGGETWFELLAIWFLTITGGETWFELIAIWFLTMALPGGGEGAG